MSFPSLFAFCALLTVTPFAAAAQTSGDYALNFDKSQTITRNDRLLRAVTLQSADGLQTLNVGTRFVYNDLTAQAFTALPGDKVQIRFNYQSGSSPWMHGYVYLDRNNDGSFSADELVSYSYADGKNSLGEPIAQNGGGWGNALQPPAFQLPNDLATGNYRLRVKIDWNNTDPAGALGEDGTITGNNSIVVNGGAVADFTLSLHPTAYPQVSLQLDTRHANLYAERGALPLQPQRGKALKVRVVPVEPSYEVEELSVHYVQQQERAAEGETQWETLALTPNAQGIVTLPAEIMQGTVRLTAHYKPTQHSKYLPVFSEEFEGDDNTQPNDKFWSRTLRRKSTWNRFCSDDAAVVFLKNGELVCRAMATPERLKGVEEQPYISGGIRSESKFSFCYGRVEARIFTHPHKGNFPAFWMMPQDNSKGWPNAGEIDIWEQINEENVSYHTLHSKWTYTLKHKSDPTSAVQGHNIDYTAYHTFAAEWTPTLITWYVDGEKIGSAPKSTNADALANGQWPYTAPFYLILNQSVGDGSWAGHPDPAFVYETRFDWVRVYQTAEQNPTLTGIDTVLADPDPDAWDTTPNGRPDARTASAFWYDLSGRRVLNPDASHGVLVRKGEKRLVF